MNNSEYFEDALKLVATEKKIIDLEKEIKDYIETNGVDESNISKEDLLNLGEKYSTLYTLKKLKDKLFSKVALGYKKFSY